jgi:nucleoside-diphosphate-sugar epimerase
MNLTQPVLTSFCPRTILVTGGAGFIGSNFIRWILRHDPSVLVGNLDALTYAGNLESLADVEEGHGPRGDGRYCFVNGDIRDFELVARLLRGDGEMPSSTSLPNPMLIARSWVLLLSLTPT